MSNRVRVIVLNWNGRRWLDGCLTALRRQTFRDFEVVLVDNGSTDDTASIIAKHRQTFPVPVLHLNEPRPGKTHALAKALAVATGDVLAFTDDDVNVEDTWIETIRAAMSEPEVALVGGPVAPRFERRPPRWLIFEGNGYGRLASPLALVDYGPRDADLGARALLGANLAVRRDVLQRVGGFAPHLGKLRGTLLSGEDDEFCRRVQASGFRARYCCSARVWHWVPASRMRLSYFLNWFFWSGITNSVLDEAMASTPGKLFGVPRYLIRRFVAAFVALPFFVLLGRRRSALDRAVDAAFVAGYAAREWGLVHVEPAVAPVPAGDAA